RVDRHEVVRLDDLKRERQIYEVRDAGLMASREGVGREVRAVGIALRKSRGSVWYAPVGRIDDDAETRGHPVACAVGLDVEMRRRTERLPDALEVRLTVPVLRR